MDGQVVNKCDDRALISSIVSAHKLGYINTWLGYSNANLMYIIIYQVFRL